MEPQFFTKKINGKNVTLCFYKKEKNIKLSFAVMQSDKREFSPELIDQPWTNKLLALCDRKTVKEKDILLAVTSLFNRLKNSPCYFQPENELKKNKKQITTVYRIIKKQTTSGNDTHFLIRKLRKFLWLFPYWETITESISDSGNFDKRFASEEAAKLHIKAQNHLPIMYTETLVCEIS